MKLRRRRRDTRVGTIEREYGLELNARSDMHLGTLLEIRGFSSLSTLLSAYRGRRHVPARDRPLFFSFFHPHGRKKGWVKWLARELGYDVVRTNNIRSERRSYIVQELRERIDACTVLVCLIGYGTHNRTWVRWEMEEALRRGRGICGIRLRVEADAAGRRGRPAKLPPLFEVLDLPVVDYPTTAANRVAVIRTIEQAAARGSRYRKEDVERARRLRYRRS